MLLSLITALLIFASTMSGYSSGVPQRKSVSASGVHGRRTKLINYDYEVCPQVESLHCKNGSTCAPGVAKFPKAHEELGLQTQESGWHCVCPKGFIGHECDVEVNECDAASDSVTACYNGATCRNGPNGAYCDCKEANDASGSTETKFAGQMCQHESTSLCAVSLVGSHAPNHQFCTNHGKCVKMVSGGEPHPGCICTAGWTGNHCEIRGDPFALKPVQTVDNSSGGNMAVGLIIGLGVLGVFLAGLGVVFLRKRSGGDEEKKSTELSSSVFRDEGGVEGNGTSTEKTVLAIGDLEPDGSNTLGSPTHTRDEGEDEDLVQKDDEYLPETEVV
ncbi:hypothetical protein ACHAWF_002346 [Thalassiosira exigua]